MRPSCAVHQAVDFACWGKQGRFQEEKVTCDWCGWSASSSSTRRRVGISSAISNQQAIMNWRREGRAVVDTEERNLVVGLIYDLLVCGDGR